MELCESRSRRNQCATDTYTNKMISATIHPFSTCTHALDFIVLVVEHILVINVFLRDSQSPHDATSLTHGLLVGHRSQVCRNE